MDDDGIEERERERGIQRCHVPSNRRYLYAWPYWKNYDHFFFHSIEIV